MRRCCEMTPESEGAVFTQRTRSNRRDRSGDGPGRASRRGCARRDHGRDGRPSNSRNNHRCAPRGSSLRSAWLGGAYAARQDVHGQDLPHCVEALSWPIPERPHSQRHLQAVRTNQGLGAQYATVVVPLSAIPTSLRATAKVNELLSKYTTGHYAINVPGCRVYDHRLWRHSQALTERLPQRSRTTVARWPSALSPELSFVCQFAGVRITTGISRLVFAW